MTVVGAVAGGCTAVGLLLSPLVAWPADRGARKAVMFWSAVVAAVAMGVLALAVAHGRPSLVLLLGALLAECVAAGCYQAAAPGTVALLTPHDDIPRVVAGVEAGEQGALVLGPALGGVLYQLSRTLPFVVDALSYVVTAVCVRSMRSDLRSAEGGGPVTRPRTEHAHPGQAPDGADAGNDTAAGNSAELRNGVKAGSRAESTNSAKPGSGAEPADGPRATPGEGGGLRTGLRLVRSSPLLRLVLVWATAVNGVLVALSYHALIMLSRHGHGGVPMGLVLAVAGAAGLLGALAAPALVGRLGSGTTLVAVTWLLVPLVAGLVVAASPWTFGLLFGSVCLLLPLVSVVLQSAVAQSVPVGVQARVAAVLTVAGGLVAALAPAVTGALAEHAGTSAPPVACAAVLAVLALHTTASGPRLLSAGASS